MKLPETACKARAVHVVAESAGAALARSVPAEWNYLASALAEQQTAHVDNSRTCHMSSAFKLSAVVVKLTACALACRCCPLHTARTYLKGCGKARSFQSLIFHAGECGAAALSVFSPRQSCCKAHAFDNSWRRLGFPEFRLRMASWLRNCCLTSSSVRSERTPRLTCQ